MESLESLTPSEFEPVFNSSLISSGLTEQPQPEHISQPVHSDCFSWDNCIVVKKNTSSRTQKCPWEAG